MGSHCWWVRWHRGSIRQRTRASRPEPGSPGASTQAAGKAGIGIGLLIFNAGASVGAVRFLDTDIDEIDRMIDMNCRATTHLAHHFGTEMRRRGHGGIALMGSVAGFAGTSFQSVYSATKAFDWILAESLWHDMGGDGVDVVALVLGATSTPSHERSGADFTGQTVMTPDEVAAEGLANLGSGPLYVVGEHNRAVVPFVTSEDRALVVSTMSEAAAEIAGRGHVPVQPRTLE